MTSSKSYELTLIQEEVSNQITFTTQDTGETRVSTIAFRTDRPLFLRIVGPEDAIEVRARVGTDVVGFLSAQLTFAERNIQAWLNDLYGEAEMVIECRSAFEFDAEWHVLFVYMLPLVVPRETALLYETLITELERAHLSLSRDFIGGSILRRPHAHRPTFDPSSETERISRHFRALRSALQSIGQRPATDTVVARQVHRWRPGDRIDASMMRSILRDKDTYFVNNVPHNIGTVTTARLEATQDIAEHRHLRTALINLARRADALRQGCTRAADLIAREEEIWGLKRQGSTASVYDERFAPRVEKLRELEREAKTLGDGLRGLLRTYLYIATAGVPRTRLESTPRFANRKGYREAYRTLREIQRERSFSADDPATVRLRRLDLLYEYWSFVCTVTLLHELLGEPIEGGEFRVVDEVFRPELAPGQRFVWQRRDQSRVYAYYEPAIPPLDAPQNGPHGWRASLVGAPVRPDVLVVIEEPGRQLRAIALDAKSTARFDRRNLTQYTDYRTLVHDPRTGLQPIRQMFFLHRDPRGSFSSYPGHFDGYLPLWESSVMGAVPLLPGARDQLAYLLETFLVTPNTRGPLLERDADGQELTSPRSREWSPWHAYWVTSSPDS